MKKQVKEKSDLMRIYWIIYFMEITLSEIWRMLNLHFPSMIDEYL